MMKEVEKLMKGSVHEEYFYRPWCFSVDDSEGDDQMDEREQLIPSLIAGHEWIAGRDTLWRVPAQDRLFALIIWYVAKTLYWS